MKNNTVILIALSVILAVPTSQVAFAGGQEKLDFAAGLEEALGHFWAIELNLDQRNAELAVIHATHPIAELYDAMQPELAAADPDLDDQFRTTLVDLKDTASVSVSRTQAQAAIEDAKDLVEDARTAVVGDVLSDDPHFKLLLMKSLLETSISEYKVAIVDGQIGEMAEFQDGKAFVVRSQAILGEIASDIDPGNMNGFFTDLLAAYDSTADPAEVESITRNIINGIDREANKLAGERLDFAGGLEEALGHFRAIELNLDEQNAELAVVHATHPIAELYDSMSPQLSAADPALDDQFRTTLVDLKDTASVDVSRVQAQAALEDAKDLVGVVRASVVGEVLSDDTSFKMQLMKSLLMTSMAEYKVAVVEDLVAELQDGSAFVWRSQQILNEVRSDVDVGDMDDIYADLWLSYATSADPSKIDEITNSIINRIDRATGFVDQEKLDFAAGLEEALGHFSAIELNLDERNAELAVIHATHPIAELYDSMSPQLSAADPALDDQFRTTLVDLKDTASVDVSRVQAQAALEDAKDLVEDVRTAVVGDELSNDAFFKLRLMKSLLDTSIAEYKVAIVDGQIGEMAEFQDGYAFVVRSQVIFGEVRTAVSATDAGDIDALYVEILTAYNDMSDPAIVDSLTSGVISRIDSITGDSATGLLDYVANIRTLLADARAEYIKGTEDSTALALSYATKSYLDNYEFIEGPLIDAGERDLMVEVELMMREDLRNLIKQGAPTSQVAGLIDSILDKLDTIEGILEDVG